MKTVKIYPVLEIPPEGFRWETHDETIERLKIHNNHDLSDIANKLVPLKDNELCAYRDDHGGKAVLTANWYKDHPQ